MQYMTSPRSNFTRGPWYEAFNTTPDRTNVLSERNEKKHKSLRAKLMRGVSNVAMPGINLALLLTCLQYSGRDLPNLEQDIEDRIGDLLTIVERRSAQGQPVDVAKLASYFTLDVLTQQGFEQPVGYLKQERDMYSFIESVKQFAVVSELGSHFPRFQALLSSRIMAPLRPRATDKTGLGAMMGIAKGVVARRFAETDDAAPKMDMLGSWMRCGLSAKEAENESITETLGGSDSTATAIRMIFLNVISNPAVYSKLMAELEGYLKPVMKQSDAKTLPYLQACIKEGLRICPPLGGLGTRLPPPEGATLNGVFIPAGIEVGVNVYSAQRNQSIFGKDADIYRPERWLRKEKDAEKLKKMEKTVDLVFSSGKYSCLGKTVAFMMLDKVLPALLVNYTWACVNPDQPIRVRCHGFCIHEDFNCVATTRTRHGKD